VKIQLEQSPADLGSHCLGRYAIPAYFHPQDDPAGWRTLAALGPALAFAIVNPDSGPASAADPRYDPAIEAVHRTGGRVIGYVDTGYGRRSGSAMLRELAAYRSWYGLRGVFFDQVTSGAEHLAHYRRLTIAARRIGFDHLVLNPGVVPDPGYAALADVLVTFEGTWAAYRDHRPVDWMRQYPRESFAHLVHSAPPTGLTGIGAISATGYAAIGYVTELTGSNPWAGLCAVLRLDAQEPAP
jgi:Spherulation-specific family 4